MNPATEIELLCAPAPDGNLFQAAKLHLIAALARLPVPVIDAVPEPDQIESIGNFIRSVARFNDQLMRVVGAELQANALCRIRLDNFQQPFSDAIEGFALWDIACVAEEARAAAEA